MSAARAAKRQQRREGVKRVAPVMIGTTGGKIGSKVFTEARSNNDKANERRAQMRARMDFLEGRVTGIATRFVDLTKEYPDAVRIERKRPKERGGGNSIQKADDVKGTIFDRGMGPLNGYQECKTCHQGMDSCPTHAGLIYLPEEAHFVDPLALKYAYYVLQSVCNSCGRLLVDR